MAYNPNAWVGADDPSRAADIPANYTPPQGNDPLSVAIRGMLTRYNQPGGYTPAGGAPMAAPNAAVPANPYGKPASRMGIPGAPTGLQTPAATPLPSGLQMGRQRTGSTGNMFLDAAAPAAAGTAAAPTTPAAPLPGASVPSGAGIDPRLSPTGTTPAGTGTSAALTGEWIPHGGAAATAPGAVDPLAGYMDPSYQFRFDQGLRALDSNAAANGSLMSGQTLKDLTNYGQNAASQEYNAAYGRMNTDRNYQTALDEWNRTFGRDTAQQDWSNNTQTINTLLNAGLAGAGGSSQVQQLIARLISAGALAQGQAGAAQTGAGSNLWTNLITQLLQLGPGF